MSGPTRRSTSRRPPLAAAALDLGRREAEGTWLAGGQAGCNYLAGDWVFGVEVDGHAQRWGQTDILAGVVLAPFVNGSTFELHSDWQASARGRIGYAMNRTLFYGTAGAAFTEVRSQVNWLPFFGPGVISSQSRTLVGVTVGAGVEHAITDNLRSGWKAATAGTSASGSTSATCPPAWSWVRQRCSRRPGVTSSWRPARSW